MRRVLLSLVFASAASLALAMVGGSPPASDAVARRVALIVGSRGNFCLQIPIRVHPPATATVPKSHATSRLSHRQHS
jgi:hypothetical protein